MLASYREQFSELHRSMKGDWLDRVLAAAVKDGLLVEPADAAGERELADELDIALHLSLDDVRAALPIPAGEKGHVQKPGGYARKLILDRLARHLTPLAAAG